MIARWLSAALAASTAITPAIAYADCCSVDALQSAAPLTGTELFPVFQSAPPLSRATTNALSGFVISNLSRLTPTGVQFARTTAGALPTCNSTTEGSVRAVVDSTSNVAGASISGGGAFHVSAYCNGSSWVVWSGTAPTTPGYYFDAVAGNDTNNCQSPAQACQTIAHLNTLSLPSGSNVFFKGGQSFSGSIMLLPANAPGPITVSTYGVGSPTISSGAAACLTATNIPGVTVNGMTCTGSGNTTNGTPGISIVNSQAGNTSLSGPAITNNTVSGYGLNGIEVLGATGTSGFSGITISNNLVHDTTGNSGTAGEKSCITINSLVAGYGHHGVHANATVKGNTVYNCTGTASTATWTGSGIEISEITGATMQNNVAHDTGINNTHVGGPVGIWTYDSTNVTIQFNESYHNLTNSTADGDGFDCDGGVINCVMQYNFAHDNQGAGLLIDSFNDGTIISTNGITARYNISQNNNTKSNGYGEIYVFGGAAMSGLAVYNNTVYAGVGGLALVENGGTSPSGHVANNILFGVAGQTLVNWADTASISLTGNDYFASANFTWGVTSYTTYASWQSATGQEKIGGVNVGLTSNPSLYVPGGGFIGAGSGYDPAYLMAYNLQVGSAMAGAGLDLNTRFSINPGTQDFYGNAIQAIGGSYPVGAAVGDFSTFAASCTATTNFLARVSSFSKANNVNYNSLICGMVSDGDWANLDAVYMLAAPNSAAALLNLVGTSFGLTAHGTITFSANNGYTGDGSTGYLDTGFTPSTAGGHYALNSATLGVYVLNARTTGDPTNGDVDIGEQDASSFVGIWGLFGNGFTVPFFGINEFGSGFHPGSGSGNSQGQWGLQRTDSSHSAGYMNGSSISTGSDVSTALPSASLYIDAYNQSGASRFAPDQIAAALIGGSVSVPNTARRINSFATALGINVY